MSFVHRLADGLCYQENGGGVYFTQQNLSKLITVKASTTGPNPNVPYVVNVPSVVARVRELLAR